jgi:hypothetical protein
MQRGMNIDVCDGQCVPIQRQRVGNTAIRRPYVGESMQARRIVGGSCENSLVKGPGSCAIQRVADTSMQSCGQPQGIEWWNLGVRQRRDYLEGTVEVVRVRECPGQAEPQHRVICAETHGVPQDGHRPCRTSVLLVQIREREQDLEAIGASSLAFERRFEVLTCGAGITEAKCDTAQSDPDEWHIATIRRAFEGRSCALGFIEGLPCEPFEKRGAKESRAFGFDDAQAIERRVRIASGDVTLGVIQRAPDSIRQRDFVEQPAESFAESVQPAHRFLLTT